MTRLTVIVVVATVLLIAALTSAREDSALVLARGCAAEIGLRGRLDECALMYSILLAKTDKGGLPELVERYNSLFGRPKSSRGWILRLDSDGTRPRGWPSNLSWPHYRSDWVDMYHDAQWFLLDTPPHPCPEANQYGSHGDEVPACWQRQWCGKPGGYWAQVYWKMQRCDSDKGTGDGEKVLGGGSLSD